MSESVIFKTLRNNMLMQLNLQNESETMNINIVPIYHFKAVKFLKRFLSSSTSKFALRSMFNRFGKSMNKFMSGLFILVRLNLIVFKLGRSRLRKSGFKRRS